jgi:hypothetical protein
MTASTEQTVLSAIARATTARLGRTTTRLFDDLATAARLGGRTRRLSRAAAARLSFAAAARLCSAAALAAMAAAEQLGARLAFHHDRHANQGRQSNGGSHHKVLTHRKSSK